MKNREGLLAFLNHFELIAIGIEKDTLDEELYKDWMGTSVVRYWYQAQPYIARSRLKNKRAFERFCQLAKKWEKDPKIATSMADLSDLQKIEADETASARSAGHL